MASRENEVEQAEVAGLGADHSGRGAHFRWTIAGFAGEAAEELEMAFIVGAIVVGE